MPNKYDHDLIRAMLRVETPFSEIMERTGCGKRTVERIKSDMVGKGEAPQNGLQERLAKAKLMVEDRAPVAEIARTLHMSRDTVRKYFPEAAWTNEQALEFATMHQSGRSGFRAAPLRPGDGDPRHGQNGYSNLKCRCEICKAWQSEYARKRHGGTAPKNPGKYDVARSTGNGLKTRDMLALEKSLGLSYDD